MLLALTEPLNPGLAAAGGGGCEDGFDAALVGGDVFRGSRAAAATLSIRALATSPEPTPPPAPPPPPGLDGGERCLAGGGCSMTTCNISCPLSRKHCFYQKYIASHSVKLSHRKPLFKKIFSPPHRCARELFTLALLKFAIFPFTNIW